MRVLADFKVDGEGVYQRTLEGHSGSRYGVWSIRSAYEGGTVFVTHYPRPQGYKIVQRGAITLSHLRGL